MKKKKSIFIFLAFLLIFTGCKTEQEINTPNELLTVEQAKMWYEAQYSNGYYTSNRMKVPENDSASYELELLLEWNNAELENDSLWSVVELPWEYSNGGIKIAIGDCAEGSRSALKVVIMKNLSTGNVYGFKMAIIPSSDYKTLTDDINESNSYLKRNNDFSGLVMYYSLDDNVFVNGWRYENGIVIESLMEKEDDNIIPSNISQSRKIMKIMSVIAVTTCYEYNVQVAGSDNITYGEDCTTGYFGGGSESSEGSIISTGSYDYTYNTGFAGGGSSTTNSTTPTIKPSIDCDENATVNGDSISKILKTNDSSAAYYQISNFINQLIGYASSSNLEWGMVINSYDGTFSALLQNGQYVNSGSSSNYSCSYSNYTILICHTHPSGKTSSPSPTDAGTLVSAYLGGAANIYGNVIFAANGTQYVIYVNNRTAFNNFCKNSSNTGFYQNTSDNKFSTGTTWSNDYLTVYNNLKKQGYSDDICNSYAISYVLDKYNTGMKISERSGNNDSFKEQNTESMTTTKGKISTTSYSPTKCN